MSGGIQVDSCEDMRMAQVEFSHLSVIGNSSSENTNMSMPGTMDDRQSSPNLRIRPDTVMHVISHNLSLLPLLEFDYDYVVFSGLISSGNNKIYALGGQGNIVFYSDSYFVINFRIVHDVAHELHRILPR